MRLLILGGSGFVSSHLVEMAIGCGHEVWHVTRGKRTSAMNEKAHSLIADRNDPSSLNAALKESGVRVFDAALDCICFTAEHASIDLEVLEGYTDRVVVISTESVYHPAFKKVPQDENGERYLDDGFYGANKRRMEETFINKAPKSLKWTLFRPPHIYGPGSWLGCFPEHTRQADLLEYMKAGKSIRLVGGGQYLIEPLYVEDLCRVMLESINNEKCYNEIFCISGPDTITNRRYFEIIGEILQVPVTFETIPEEGYLDTHPYASGNLCHRVYNKKKLADTGIRLPDMSIEEGLKIHTDYLLSQEGLL